MKTLLGMIAVVAGLASASWAGEESFILETALGEVEAVWDCAEIQAYAPAGAPMKVKVSEIQAISVFPSTLMHHREIGNLQHFYSIYKVTLKGGGFAFTARVVKGSDLQTDCSFKLKQGAALPTPPTWYPLGGALKAGVAYLRQIKRPGIQPQLPLVEVTKVRPAIESCILSQIKKEEAGSQTRAESESRRADCLRQARAQCRCDQMASVFCDQCLDGRCPLPVIRGGQNANDQPCDWIRFPVAQ